jgi:hypothetical protein
MSTENMAQGHTTIEEEEEAVMKNLQLGGSGSSSGSYHSPRVRIRSLITEEGGLERFR